MYDSLWNSLQVDWRSVFSWFHVYWFDWFGLIEVVVVNETHGYGAVPGSELKVELKVDVEHEFGLEPHLVSGLVQRFPV